MKKQVTEILHPGIGNFRHSLPVNVFFPSMIYPTTF